MKRLLYALSAFLVVCAGSCALTENGIHTKTGKTETRTFDVKDFTKVHLGGGITTVRIVQSDTYNVSVTTDSGLFDYFDIAAKGDTLVIRERWGFGVSVTYDCNVTITMPKIRELNAVNSSAAVLLGSFRQADTDLDIRTTSSSSVDADVSAKNIYADASGETSIALKGNAENFRCSASSGSKIDADVSAKNIYTNASGETSINLKGSAEHLRCSASGGSEIRAYKCKSANIDATVRGSAAVYVYAEKSLNAHVSGGGSLYYRGKPEKFNKTVRNSGRIYNK